TRVFHNPGKQHQFADLLSRWGYADTSTNKPRSSSTTCISTNNIPKNTSDDKDLRSDVNPASAQANISWTNLLYDFDSIQSYFSGEEEYLDGLVTAVVEESLHWIDEEASGFSIYDPTWTTKTPSAMQAEIRRENIFKRTGSLSTITSTGSTTTAYSNFEVEDFTLDCGTHTYNFVTEPTETHHDNPRLGIRTHLMIIFRTRLLNVP
ncbi:MAG: hypothetical protein MI921_01605, partial [Cytophagales bacterium]|nr:hypothetical protein [Cytophagales bacterium]